jgi:hypothetical protein
MRMNDTNYHCAEGCGIAMAAACPKWKKCYAGDNYKRTRKLIREYVDRLDEEWKQKNEEIEL